MKQVCNWNFLLPLVIDADRRIILSKTKSRHFMHDTKKITLFSAISSLPEH
jgi:hypothetical protein